MKVNLNETLGKDKILIRIYTARKQNAPNTKNVTQYK